MAKNKNLQDAKRNKNDEFYTQYEDIHKELINYKELLKNKIILCNCDDYNNSNFYKYFINNFEELELKKLICSGYSINNENGISKNRAVLFNGSSYSYLNLNGDEKYNSGDFRSKECIELLKEADIVVTNPPFSLFREYVDVLMAQKKNFLIIGNQNAITFKEIFPLIKNNKLWLGNGFKGNVGFFHSPYEDVAKSTQHKEGMVRVSGVMWFTNMDHKKRHEEIILYESYDPEKYPKYDNYDAIEVSKTKEIPEDYDGVMGVPITFLDKYCPEQFEIIDINPHFFSIVEQGLEKPKQLKLSNVGKKDPYARILIKNKKPKIKK